MKDWSDLLSLGLCCSVMASDMLGCEFDVVC